MMTEKIRVSASSVISSVAETSAIAGEVACGRCGRVPVMRGLRV